MIRLENRNRRKRRLARRQRAFTLVELLVTVSIIGILASATLVGLQGARQAAQAAKTKAMIAKLDRIIMARYERYRTRRIPISTSGMSPKKAAEERLAAIRDLMRLEMPDRWTDTDLPLVLPVSQTRMARPALAELYRAKFLRRREALADQLGDQYEAEDRIGKFASAECLYMIINSGSCGEREQFKQSEIGDADADGLPEFHDGWGRPIRFLRWAPGFSDESEIQVNDPINNHDPFDPMQIHPEAYHLIPLIYSAGPDGIYDLDLQGTDTAHHYDGNPYSRDIGGPGDVDGDGALNHLDNIHNHLIEAN